MKKVLRVSGKNSDGASIQIVATLTAERGDLTRDELERAATDLADGIMRVIPNVTYLGVPMSKLKIT